VFGDRLSLAVRYGDGLAGPGVERGLIGPHETERLWHRHLLNSAAVAALIPPVSTVVDVGSGAGMPGIVLALARPDLRVILVESMLRRTAFLDEVVADLGLDGVEVRRARAEDLRKPRLSADVVTARAVAPVDRLAGLAAPLLRPGGQLLALKGAAVAHELAAGWPSVRRAAMVDNACLFAVVPAATAGSTTGSGSTAGAVESSTSWDDDDVGVPWLRGVAVQIQLGWRPDGVPRWNGASPGGDPGVDGGAGPEDEAVLALVLRLRRSPQGVPHAGPAGLG
jgi:16S rRNA (guanine527-N7)-methyltransferase